MENKTSPHILQTATNLLGFCLIVITSLKVSSISETSFIDEFTAIIAILLSLSCILSFLSIKSTNILFGNKLEKVADYFFGTALIGIFFIVMAIVLKFFK